MLELIMIFFTLVLMVLLPLICHFSSIALNRRIKIHYLILFMLMPLSIISNILIPFKFMQFEHFQIIVLLLFSIEISVSFSWVLYKWFKNKCSFNQLKKDVLKPIIISLSILSIILISLLINVKFNLDTTFSINVSNNFRNSIYASEDYVGDGFSGNYLNAAYLFVLPALFTGEIILIYSIFLPLMASMFLFSFVNEISTSSIKKYKNFYCCVLCLAILVCYFTFLSAFQIPWIITIFILLMLMLETKNNNPITWYIYVLGVGFVSTTAYMLCLPIIIGVMIYYLLCKKYKELILFLPLLIYLFGLNAYIGIFNNTIFYSCIISISLLLCILTLSLYLVDKNIWKKYQWEFQFSKNKIFTSERNKFIIPIFLLIIPSSLIAYILGTGSVDIFYIILSIVLNILLIYLYFLSTKNKDSMITNTIACIFIIAFISMCEYAAVIILQPDNPLIFRVSYLFIGYSLNFPYAGADAIMLILLFIYIISEISEHQWFKKITDFFNAKEINIKTRKMSMHALSATLMISSAPIACAIALPHYLYFVYDFNRSGNLETLSYDEINFLKTIDFKKYSKTYIADFAVGAYLNQASNITSFINYSGDPALALRSQFWQNDGFDFGVLNWNHFFTNNKIVYDNLDVAVKNMLIRTVEYINSGLLDFDNVKTSQKFDSVDFIFIYKYERHKPYYNIVETALTNAQFKYPYQTIYDSKNLLALKRV